MKRLPTKSKKNTASTKKIDLQTSLIISEKRLLWPDVIRAFAIYLVVQVHTLYTPVHKTIFFLMFKNFDLLGVPLFVLLSGSLLLGKEEGYRDFFRKRCMKVLLPWLVWTFLYMAYFYLFQKQMVNENFFLKYHSEYSALGHFFFQTFMSALWFLPMIFGIYLVAPLLRILVKYAQKFDLFYLLALWFIFLSVLPSVFQNSNFPIWEPTIIMEPIQFSGYFLLGFVIIRYQLLSRLQPWKVFVLSILSFAVSLIKLPYVTNIVSGYMFPGIVFSSVCFFYWMFIVIKQYESRIPKKVGRIFQLVSGASFGIYIVHAMILDYSGKYILRFLNPLHMGFLLTVIIFSLSFLVVFCIKKLPVLRYIVP